ncbi:MerR family transcriptional regulator [Actinomadura spongiicola]|uniref:MerR family transcriptional regulator n=1 Tax=Actinomadura spongiicola TaxID=2303421 RepID=A0A372GE86_9ACTN|nr:MerR family transcriptional regulator [Actinomadura spongiicola]RFS83677.1 MerR family transcriptional regulator [Actinomadura spongiicola]
MRIAELSRSSGVPVPTIKYYMREGLVPPGELTNRNQAQYTDEHLRRLRLARALIEVGGLPVATAKRALAALDAAGNVRDALGKAQYAATTVRPHTVDDEAWGKAQAAVSGLLAGRDWAIKADGPALLNLTETVAALHRLGQDDLLAMLDHYADAAEALARAELPEIARRTTTDGMAEAVVLWTVLGDALLAALRRLAQENESAKVFNATTEPTT